jgi:beta-lactamase superfamily II metal-dependent hydrolase
MPQPTKHTCLACLSEASLVRLIKEFGLESAANQPQEELIEVLVRSPCVSLVELAKALDVPELREILSAHGLAVTGEKAKLVARLRASFRTSLTQLKTQKGRSGSADDVFSICALPIGQGDAILMQWRSGSKAWTCLVDGGPSWRSLKAALASVRHQIEVQHLDLLVLTHLDSDHCGGLINGLESGEFPSIGSYWGPALAAFERHSWLFGTRCAQALARGRRLEDALTQMGVDIVYPLEGFSSAPPGADGLRIEVLNPPKRLIWHLLSTDDIINLVSGPTTPLGWLLEPIEQDPERPEDDLFVRGDLDYLTPTSIPLRYRTPSAQRHDPESCANEAKRTHDVEPIFYGNQLFNNSSIVLWIDVPTGSRRHRILLPGDLENWTYVAARHSKGLQPDLLKAPHHGGRLYIEGGAKQRSSTREAIDEVHRFLRPRNVLVSSEGGHGLPRDKTRESWIRWGASVFCTCRRHLEVVMGPESGGTCCYDNHSCQLDDKTPMLLRMTETSVTADRAACHSGFGDSAQAPVILRQELVSPSGALQVIGGLEMRRFVNWISKTLRQIHKNCVEADIQSRPIRVDYLTALARSDGNPMLAHNMDMVLNHAAQDGVVWLGSVAGPRSTYSSTPCAYPTITPGEVTILVEDLRALTAIVFPGWKARHRADPATLLLSLKWDGVASWVQTRLGYPTEVFSESILPVILKEIRSESWSVSIHRGDGVALFYDKEPRQLFEALVRAWRTPIDNVWAEEIEIGPILDWWASLDGVSASPPDLDGAFHDTLIELLSPPELEEHKAKSGLEWLVSKAAAEANRCYEERIRDAPKRRYELAVWEIPHETSIRSAPLDHNAANILVGDDTSSSAADSLLCSWMKLESAELEAHGFERSQPDERIAKKIIGDDHPGNRWNFGDLQIRTLGVYLPARIYALATANDDTAVRIVATILADAFEHLKPK